MTWGQVELTAVERAPSLTRPVRSAGYLPGLEALTDLLAARLSGTCLEPLAPGQETSGGPVPEGTWTLMRTSGSTGEPQSVALTHENHDASAEAAREHLALTPDDRWLACLPFHHVGGLSIFVRAAHTGLAVVPVWPFEPDAVMVAAEHHQVTAMSLVPTMLQRLVAAGWEPPSSLRFALLGGAPCPPLLLQAALDRGIPVAPTYGMTETCSQVATMLPGEVESHFGSAGRALPGVELRITDDERVAVRGPMVSPVVVGPDGWLITNDLGVIDSQGFLTVLGRADEAIVTGGEKVAPRRVEQLLLEDPAVSEAAVVGLADPEWGERVVAAVTARPGATPDPEILRGLVRERLAPHMVPKSVVILDAMPHTGPGKVDRPELRRLLEETTR